MYNQNKDRHDKIGLYAGLIIAFVLLSYVGLAIRQCDEELQYEGRIIETVEQTDTTNHLPVLTNLEDSIHYFEDGM